MSEPCPYPLVAVGWSDRVQALLSALVDQGLVPARVVGVERGLRRVATPDGERWLPAPRTAVGDWVALDGQTVQEIAPRWSALGRIDPTAAGSSSPRMSTSY